jgi:dihydrodipicolinate synthase/N-acetylneuraminate lyase
MQQPDAGVAAALHDGLVIPAHPLALDGRRELQEARQRALTRYYLASGAGGVAVAVHTTQFEIRDAGLLEPVLRLAAEEVKAAELSKAGWGAGTVKDRPFVMVAGVCGPTEQALREAELARGLGYHLGLLSTGGLADSSEEVLLQRAQAVSEIIPLFGFYLQPAVGGRVLSFEFWREFCRLEGVAAIKIAPFNRYQTLDVVRAVAASGRAEEIALYTGNDDNVVGDLLTVFRLQAGGGHVEKRIVGGLLGQWAVWTHAAVELLERVKRVRADNQGRAGETLELLTLGAQLTDANAAVFDAAHGFRGCIPGINEVLHQQGLLEGNWCLDPHEVLSPGQLDEIDRVSRAYPHLSDDDFVADHLDEWLGRKPTI